MPVLYKLSIKNIGYKLLVLLSTLIMAQAVLAANDVPTQFTNTDGIINTRHNMMQSTESVNFGQTMNYYRNSYGEVCVYCHTPHGANATVKAPLWNRNITATTYTTYNQLGTNVNQTYSQPGAASLSCLSCHDGQQAFDAILNMPGSGQYSATASPWTWNATVLAVPPGGARKSNNHLGFAVGYNNSGGTSSAIGPNTTCMTCHNPDSGTGLVGDPTDFTIFNIGTDLSNDHPVGVTFPTSTGAGTDWNTPGGTKGTTKFFDENGNGRLDKTDIRLYDSGGGPEVECATCHDPHGVPTAGAGSPFIKTFLRKTNAGSAVCLTCHTK